MEARTNQGVGEKLEAWIKDRRPDPTFGGGAVSANGVEGHLRHVLAMARLIAEGIAATGADLKVKDRNSYSFISSKLGDLLGFADFSLAEYTFALSNRKNPGIRLKFERAEVGPQLSVVAFEDVLQWRVDYKGKKLSQILLVLNLGGDDVTVSNPYQESTSTDAAPPWQEQLREAFLVTTGN